MKKRKFKKLRSSLVAFAIFFLYLAIGFVVPAYATKIIFNYGLWLAQFLVYLMVMYAMVRGMIDYKIHHAVASWYKKTYGHSII